MWVQTLFSILSLLLAPSVAQFTKHEFYTGPPDFIQIPEEHLDYLFKRLDNNDNGKIEKADLAAVFAHPQSAADSDKFLEEVDSGNPFQDVSREEFEKFMLDQSAVWAIAGCKLAKKALRLKIRCYQDDFISYVHSMMVFNEVVEVFMKLDFDGDGKITKSDLENHIIQNDVPDAEQAYQDTLDNLLDEWGHEDRVVTFPELKSYVRQVELYIEIKRCQHDTSNYVKTLIKYSMFALTENDIHSLFMRLDTRKRGYLDADDLKPHTTNPKPFLNIVDLEAPDHIDFEEFRLFLKRILVRNMMEEECGVCKGCTNSRTQQDCYLKYLMQLVAYAYKMAKISIPHIHMLYIFEKLDKGDTGLLEDEDLVPYQADAAVRKKIISEIDTTENNDSINLEELQYFLSYPSTIYAVAECLFQPEAYQTVCFVQSCVNFAGGMMPKSQVEPFFRAYDRGSKQKIVREDVEQLIPQGETHDEDVDNFINELGLGDDEVTYFEFSSYVRHQDLREEFEKCEGLDDKDKVITAKQDALLNYIKTRITEFDIQTLFEMFDFNKDDEIELEDLQLVVVGKPVEQYLGFLHAIDSDDQGENVDFKEFRHYCLEHRKILEDCTAQHKYQQDEISCYVDKIWQMTSSKG